MKAFTLESPTGSPIVGTVEIIAATALVQSFEEVDGKVMVRDYAGETEVCWDCQETVERCGELVVIDRNGDEWLVRECRRVAVA